VSTYVNSLYISKYGIFKDKNLNFQNGKINLIFGDNEAGKTTLMNLLRYQFYSFDKKHPARGYDGQECEAVLTVNNENITVKISGNKREITPVNAVIANLNSYISEDNFQKIFAFGQDELFNIKYKEIFGNEKNAILTATGIGVEADINDIFKNIDKSIDNLYKPRGQKPVINNYISLIRKTEKEIKDITSEISQNKDILMHYEVLKDKLKEKKNQLQEFRTKLAELEKKMTPFETYCSIKRSQDEAEALSKKKFLDKNTLSQLKDLYNSIERDREKYTDRKERLKKLQAEYAIESQEYSPVDIPKYEQILKKLNIAANEQDKISELKENIAYSEKNLKRLYEKLKVESITPEILENPSIDILVNINKEYKESTQLLKYTKKRLEEKEGEIKNFEENIAELKEDMIYPLDEIEKDYEDYKNIIDKLTEKNSQIEKSHDTIESLEKQLQGFDIKRFSLLQAKYPLYQELKSFMTFADKADQLMRYRNNIRDYMQLSGKNGFPNSIIFTAFSILVSLLLFAGFSSFFPKSPSLLWTLAFIPLGALTDMLRFVTHRKNVNNKITEINAQNKELGLTSENIHDSLLKAENILTGIAKLETVKKDLEEYNIPLKNLEQIYFEMVEKKSENDQIYATLRKIQIETETVKKETESLREKLVDVIDKYSVSDEHSAEQFFSNVLQKNSRIKNLSFEKEMLSQEITNLTKEYNNITNNLENISKHFSNILNEHKQEPFSLDNLDYLLLNKTEIQNFFYSDNIYRQKCEKLQKLTEEIKNDLAKIGVPFNDIKTDAAEIENVIKKANEKKQILNRLKIQINENKKEKELLEQNINSLNKKYKILLAEHKLANMDEAEEAYRLNEKYAEKCRELQTEKAVFKKRYGVTFDDYEKMLSKQDYASLKNKAQSVEKIQEELLEEINELTAEKAKTSEIISRLSNKDQLQKAIKQKNIYTRRLKENIQEYVTFITARTILKNAIKKFEEESQPELLNIASKYFCDITSGRYQRIKVDYNNDLILVDNKGRQKYAGLLSAGSKDQLYIALRLAYIQMIDKDLRLPLIFDETIINFDEKRQTSFISTLDKLSNDRQIFFFTCHKFIKDKFCSISNNLNVQELSSEH